MQMKVKLNLSEDERFLLFDFCEIDSCKFTKKIDFFNEIVDNDLSDIYDEIIKNILEIVVEKKYDPHKNSIATSVANAVFDALESEIKSIKDEYTKNFQIESSTN